MPQSGESSMKSRMLDEVSDCASLMPVSRSGMMTRSAPIFSSARRCVSSVALQMTVATPSSFRLSVATTLVVRAEADVLRGRVKNLPFAALGLALVVGLTLLRDDVSAVRIQFTGVHVWTLGYLFVSGAVAITAMVLPGISGSTILLIAGVYLPAIQALRSLFELDFSVLPGLCALALGFVAGVGLSIRAIRVALKKYRSQMVWLILGLMAGSLYAIAMGPAGLDTPLPPVWVQNFSVPGFLLGVLILLGLDALRRKTARKKSGA